MSETKIAKEYIKEYKICRTEKLSMRYQTTRDCKVHKQTCQRWLEFLEEEKTFLNKLYYPQYIVQEVPHVVTTEKLFVDESVEEDTLKRVEIVYDKIKDLKQAIKLYDEAGI